MTVRIGDTTFDRARYDRDADVLYLSTGDAARASDFDETPEGHHARFDDTGRLIGLTVVNARAVLDRDGELRVTLPQPQVVAAAELESALAG
jgi:uncharacterized protein YuzE